MRIKISAIAILTIAIIAALALHARQDFLQAEWTIEYDTQDHLPHVLEVTSEGRWYILQGSEKNLKVQSYDPKGRSLWQAPVSKDAIPSLTSAIVSFEGRPVYSALTEPPLNGLTAWITLGDSRDLTCRSLRVDTNQLTPYVQVVPTPECIYVTGGTYEDGIHYPTAIKMDSTGLRLWKKIETGDDFISGPATVDDEGNLIVIGDIGAGAGPVVTKYSPEGERMWKRETEVLDGSQAIWVRADKRGNIYTIFELHMGNMTQSGDDMSGRKRDYVLSTYSPGGKLLETVKLSHGAWLRIKDADINETGEIIALGNRRKTSLFGYPRGNDGAQLIKCDANGQVVWSRRVKLPAECFAWQVRLDGKDGIHIIGYGEDESQTKGFVCKVVDPG